MEFKQQLNLHDENEVAKEEVKTEKNHQTWKPIEDIEKAKVHKSKGRTLFVVYV